VVDPKLAGGGGGGGGRAAGGKAGTVADPKLAGGRARGGAKRKTAVDGKLARGAGGRGGRKTVLDTGPTPPGAPAPDRRLVGFIVTYDLNPYGTFFPIYEGKTYLGTSPDADIVIDRNKDPVISGKHCLILFRTRRLTIKDEDSSNGTWLDRGTLDRDKYRKLLDDVDSELEKEAEFRNAVVSLVTIEDEKVELLDNSYFRVGRTLFKVKLIG